jgi:hypothetical protein
MTDKQELRERYSPQPVPKCRICGEEMSIQRITTGAHVTYACSGEGDDGYFKIGRTFADEHYAQSRVTIVDFSDPEVLMLLDEREADKEKIKTLESRNRRLEGIIDAAERRIAELEARVVNLPKRSIGEVMHMSGFSREYAEGWCAGNDNARHEIRVTGVKIKEE